MIFIVLLLTIGAGVIASQIAADIRSARTYYESTRAFYIAWSSVANERTWMTSGARRTAAGNDTLCGAGTSNNDCAVSVTGFVAATEFYDRDSQGVALPAGDIRRGRREYSFQILQPNNVNAVLGDGQVKVIGSFPGNDRVAIRDPMSRTALLEVTLWRNIKAYAQATGGANNPANAIDASGATLWQAEANDVPRWFYVDFGWSETVDTFSGTTTPSGAIVSGPTTFCEYWDDTTKNWIVEGNATVAATSVTCSYSGGRQTRRVRVTLDPIAGQAANLNGVAVTLSGTDVRRQGSVRPGRFSYSTNFDYTQFN